MFNENMERRASPLTPPLSKRRVSFSIKNDDGIQSVFPFGYRMSILDINATISFFKRAIDRKTKTVLLSINQHALYVALKNWHFAYLLQRHHAHIDGVPMLLLARCAGARVTRNHRFGGIDLLPALMHASAEHGWRIYYLGGSEADLRSGINNLKHEWPDAELAGHHGYFDLQKHSEENQRVVDDINGRGIDVLLVGMSMGPQETWIFENFDDLNVSAIVTVGATIRYFAKTEPIPPTLIRQSGFEWVYRLAARPQALWFRYLVEPPLTLLGLVLTGRLWNWHEAAGQRIWVTTIDRTDDPRHVG